MGQSKAKLGFTLIELVTVIGLVSIFLVLLVKFSSSPHNSHQLIRLGIQTLTAMIDNARSLAIFNNNYTCLTIDIASPYKFRRIIIYRCSNDGSWIAECVVILPERIYIVPLDTLAASLGRSLSNDRYAESTFSLNGEIVDGYTFIFDSAGILINIEDGRPSNGAIIAIGSDIKRKEAIQIDSDAPLMGVFIIPGGQQIILTSKEAIKEAW
ncbi:MAG: prepilin-type N-terminal cleavage/methylation domain-containing protein [Puniceicoccales bacterium]|nr:prepilin-type N-terminal cleavage/methylation domain-containing protein [Puniceicoccales bacterium]